AGTITGVNVAGMTATSDVEGKSKTIGGLVGYNKPSGIIQESSSSVLITAYHTANVIVESVGGLVGMNEGEILESSSISGFKVRRVIGIGGLVGSNDGLIFGSNASGSIILNTATGVGYDVARAGGLVGIHGPTSNEA